ncbi:MAG: serine/threonine protein kinase [Planctomycetes bacterium]|nr:serine/threonine protein kinase [Planctomycetota bacterium]
MQEPPDDRRTPADSGGRTDKDAVQALVAACIEALERGETDPATRVCAERPDLLTRVQRRLAQLASRGLIPDSESLPASIGPYRILRELGSGGMGSVYLAEQAEPIRRQVALKVVKLGMDTREVVARFRGERRALARMNHPHIAQVFDAGITDEGRPYFVMEYVSGRSLTSFCDQRQLPPAERVRLLATVCRAVQHAHDRGLIHRDLKPSNILVSTHEGTIVPKVIDFGIAKATTTDDGTAAEPISLQTRADQVLGTPEYMSPEQMVSGGVDVDTRTDVYSLGVTLYEQLCGELPFDSRRLRGAGRDELARILQDELPTQPSKRLSQVGGAAVSARGGERTVVQRAVAGELDWITLKALAKRREDRYPSALALAEDLERWLANEPVLAAPPGHTYRLRKFVRRHRVAVAAGCTVLASLVVALLVSLDATSEARLAERKTAEALVAARSAEERTQQALRDVLSAQQREREALDDVRAFYGFARDAVGNLVDVAVDELGDVPQADSVRRRMLDDAVAFYSALHGRQAEDPALRADLVEANGRLGTLRMQLGQTDDALVSLVAAAREADELLQLQPDEPRRVELAMVAHNRLGILHAMLSRGVEARHEFTRALAMLTRLQAETSKADYDLQEARLCTNLGNETPEADEAIVLLERALAAFARIEAMTPTMERDRARCRLALAAAATRRNRVKEAAEQLATAAASLAALPVDASVRGRELEAQVHDELARVQTRLGQREQAKVNRRRAVAIHQQLVDEHPDVLAHVERLAGGLHHLGQLAEEEADLDAALDAFTRSASLRIELMGKAKQNHRYAMQCARTVLGKARIELMRWQRGGGVPAERAAAEADLALARQIAEPLLQQHGDDVDVLTTFGGVHAALGQLAIQDGRFADAITGYQQLRDAALAMLATASHEPEVHYQLAMAGSGLLQAHVLSGDPEQGVVDGRAGFAALEAGLERDARNSALRDLAPTLAGRIAIALQNSGEHEAAARHLLQMIERRDLGNDCREQGCLLLGNVLDQLTGHAEHGVWRDQLVAALRAIVTARGDAAAAKQRPSQGIGFSHFRSRLRDFDLRLALGDQLGKLGEIDEQSRWLEEAFALAETIVDLSADRWRNLTSQRAECALAHDQPGAAVAVVEAFLGQIGDDGGSGGGDYLAACLLMQARAKLADAAERERLAQLVVRRLALALEHQQVPASAVQHEQFDELAGRAEFDALRRR